MDFQVFSVVLTFASCPRLKLPMWQSVGLMRRSLAAGDVFGVQQLCQIERNRLVQVIKRDTVYRNGEASEDVIHGKATCAIIASGKPDFVSRSGQAVFCQISAHSFVSGVTC